jgi:hypothetical protein
MKISRSDLRLFTDTKEVHDLICRDDKEIAVVLSDLEGILFVNVFAPRHMSFWNFGSFGFAERSYNFSQQRLAEGRELELSAESLLFTGDLLRAAGERYFIPKPTWHRYFRRHISLSLPKNCESELLDFFRFQERYFGQTCVTHRSEATDLSSFGWEGQNSEFSKALCRPATTTIKTGWSAVEFLQRPASTWKEELESYWIDPCPILVEDESTDVLGNQGDWLVDMRMRVADFCSVPTLIEKQDTLAKYYSYNHPQSRSLERWRNYFSKKLETYSEFFQSATL